MDTNLLYASIGTFLGTFAAMILLNYNPNPMLLVLLPMWGLIFGVSLAKVMYKREEVKIMTKKPVKKVSLKKTKKRKV